MIRSARIPLRIALVAFMLGLCHPQAVTARPSKALDEPAERPSYLIRLRKGLSHEEVDGLLSPFGLRVQRHVPGIDVWVAEQVSFWGASLDVAALRETSQVRWIEPNGHVHAVGLTPNDGYYPTQWNLPLIGLPDAWVFVDEPSGPIAVIDTGVDLDHPDLAGRIWTNEGEIPENGEDDDQNGYVDDVRGWDFVATNGDALPDDEHGHGSHVAGIAAAHTNNALGVAGVAWDASIMPLRVLNERGNGEWAHVLEAIAYAADNGANVINLSLGQSPDDPEHPVPIQAIEQAVSYARSKGCLLVAAAGNNETYQPAPVIYPAASPGVLAVAATTAGDEPWFWSNRGPKVTIAAPGVDILSTSRYNSYATLTGTSMAAPHVSGLAALLWSFDPTLSADGLTEVITSTAWDVHAFGWDERTGWGRIDAQAATRHVFDLETTLTMHPAWVPVGGQTAAITATVSLADGQPVPDGLSVSFTASLGQLWPETSLTVGGEATTTFSSQVELGEATIQADVLGAPGATNTIEVIPCRLYLPTVLLHPSAVPQ